MPDETVRRSRKFLLGAAGTIGAVFLSALGSGVWNHWGSPFLDWISRAIITVIAALVGTYKDSIYREASRGFQEYPASMLYAFVLITMPMIAIALVWFAARLREDLGSEPGPSSVSRMSPSHVFLSRVFLSRTFLYLFLLYTFATSAVSLSRQFYIRAIVVYSQSSIDRLAPHLTNAEEEELLAQFRSVQSAEDYYSFYGRLLDIFEAHGLDHRSDPPL